MLCVFTIFFVIETILAVPFMEHAKIANGVLYNHSLPYQVSLTINGHHICGGIIYSENIIITAAHCIFDPERMLENDFAIHVGTNKQTDMSKGQIITVNKFKKHEKCHKYANYTDYDIALLKLKTNLIFNDNVHPIPLATKEPENGTIGTVSGWGYTLDSRNASENLLVAEVMFKSREVCQKYTNTAEITNRMLCTMPFDDLPSSTCGGDSGGPIVANNELVGIISWGMRFHKMCDYVSIYTSIPYMKDWILKEANNM